MRLPRWHSSKESACQYRRPGFDPRVGKIPWRRKWQPTPVFLLGEFHGQRILTEYSPWGHKQSDTTEQLSLSLSSLKATYVYIDSCSSIKSLLGKFGGGFSLSQQPLVKQGKEFILPLLSLHRQKSYPC